MRRGGERAASEEAYVWVYSIYIHFLLVYLSKNLYFILHFFNNYRELTDINLIILNTLKDIDLN